jgi:prevent-host-death family protein
MPQTSPLPDPADHDLSMMYISYGMDVPLSTARESLAEMVNRVRFGGERLTLTRRGRPVAAVVSVEDAELLERLEDAADLEAARQALAEPGEPVEWEAFKAKLGL